MAFIKKDQLIRLDKNRNSIHKSVSASYSTFEHQGVKIFQIDTYRTDDRKDRGKLSQTMQFDKESASYIVELLKREFHI